MRDYLARMKATCSFVLLLLRILAAPVASAQSASRGVEPKPIETTVCAIVQNPSIFNNKLVKVRGHVSVTFEYSVLEDEGCTDGIWFSLADGSGPPGLVITANGNGRPGGKNSKGTLIPPLSVKLVRDSTFEKFERYMRIKAEAKPCIDDPTKPTPLDCSVDRVTATFTGRIDSVSKELHAAHLKQSPNEKHDFKGFGQTGPSLQAGRVCSEMARFLFGSPISRYSGAHGIKEQRDSREGPGQHQRRRRPPLHQAPDRSAGRAKSRQRCVFGAYPGQNLGIKL